MNALVGVRSNMTGLLNPTPKQRIQAAEEVSANFRANIIGRLRAAGKLEQVMPAEADPVSAAQKSASAMSKQDSGENSRIPENQLDRDAFLELLMQQVRNQDPLEPMDNTAMVAQLAQFSALEQMNNLNAGVEALTASLQQSLSFMAGSSMIGRTVSWFNEEGPQKGLVEAVTLNEGNVQLRVDGAVVPLNAVSVVE